MLLPALILLLTLPFSGCASRSGEGLSALDGLSGSHPADATCLAAEAADVLTARYAPARTGLVLVRTRGIFGEELERQLRSKGFALLPESSEAPAVGYTVDRIDMGSAYVRMWTSQGDQFSFVRRLGRTASGTTQPSPAPDVADTPPSVVSKPLSPEPLSAAAHEEDMKSKGMWPVHTSASAAVIARRNRIPVSTFCSWNNVDPDERILKGTYVALREPAKVPASVSPASSSPVAEALTEMKDRPERTSAADSLKTVHTEQWTLHPGSLRDQIAAWAERAGYQLVWNTDRDFDMHSNTRFTGAFVDVIRQLFEGLHAQGLPLTATLYTANQVLEVGDK